MILYSRLFKAAYVVCAVVAVLNLAFSAKAESVWTNVAGNVVAGEVAALDARTVSFVAGGVTQRVVRTVFPASELKRMEEAFGGADATERVPPVLAPAWRDFAAKCAAKTATRGDLITLKRFIAASALDEAAKKLWTQKARKLYQESKKQGQRSEVKGQTAE